MTPEQLDYLINGAKVFIYKRHDGTVYACLDDFSRFGATPLETLRIPLNKQSTTESVKTDPKVKKRLAEIALTSREGK